MSTDNDVLTMFFDENFVPHDFVDALFTSSLAQPTLDNSDEFASPRAIQGLQGKFSSLLTHLDYYTNELTRQFEDKMKNLENSSSIISQSDGDDTSKGITRLEYYVGNLSSSLNSISRDLKHANEEVAQVTEQSTFQKTEVSVADLQQMIHIREGITKVIDVFERVRSLVASSTESDAKNLDQLAPTGGKPVDIDEPLTVSAEAFQSALSLLKELILEQVSAERRKAQEDPDTYTEPKADFVSILDGMIELDPFFRNMSKFSQPYTHFVEFLQKEKQRYQNIFI